MLSDDLVTIIRTKMQRGHLYILLYIATLLIIGTYMHLYVYYGVKTGYKGLRLWTFHVLIHSTGVLKRFAVLFVL